jgi:hypothetical protein
MSQMSNGEKPTTGAASITRHPVRRDRGAVDRGGGGGGTCGSTATSYQTGMVGPAMNLRRPAGAPTTAWRW